MAVAACTSRVYATGASTAMTTEACAGSGSTYQITNTAKRVIDPEAAVSVFANGVLQAATTYTLDHLFGIITFTGTPTAPITITGYYLPVLELDETTKASLSLTRDELDTTVFKSTEFRTRILGLQSAELTITVLSDPNKDYDSGGGTLKLETVLDTPQLKMFELVWPGGTSFRMLGYAKSNDNPNDVEGRREATFTVLATQPSNNATRSFSWSA